MCNRINLFVLRRDQGALFRFAALQSHFAQQTLERHGHTGADLDTIYVVVNLGRPDELLLEKGKSVVYVLRRLGGGWRLLATGLRLLPLALLNFGYDLIARNRYRLFGRYESCLIPPPEWRPRFIEVE